MNKELNTRTRAQILAAAKTEFAKEGFRAASLRSIVRSVGMTTGAFYGYYKSKEALFDALVGEQYAHLMDCYRKAHQDFAALPPAEQPKHMSDISGRCLEEMLHYAYANLEVFKLILLRSDGTRFSHMVDEMVALELQATHDYQAVLAQLGQPVPAIDERLEHILITGMFNAYFELVIHEMPLQQALEYLRELRSFYTAGWLKIMGQ
ncbi:MAG: helix-turn-helix domain-containing protein [Eubacteriales bacterium]|nr:helix-turn-helix domain-containing protein [Eubacteriales bacterium]